MTEELAIPRHGSREDAEIAKLDGSLAFLLDEFRRLKKSARRCYERGNMVMYRRNSADAAFSRVQWKLLNNRRSILRADLARAKAKGAAG